MKKFNWPTKSAKKAQKQQKNCEKFSSLNDEDKKVFCLELIKRVSDESIIQLPPNYPLLSKKEVAKNAKAFKELITLLKEEFGIKFDTEHYQCIIGAVHVSNKLTEILS